jgi:hypothetical protein
MRRRLLVLAGTLALLLVACGDDDGTTIAADTTMTTETPADDPDDRVNGDDIDEGDDAVDPAVERPDWDGELSVDTDTGEVDIVAYAAFLADHGPPTGGGTEEAALELVDIYGDEYQARTVESLPADGGRTIVTVTFEGLMDDSVAAVRYELVFIGDSDDLILESGQWSNRCQPGRGHQEFDVALCV